MEVFRKFDLVRFDKERTQDDFDRFLTNSNLYDPREPDFQNKRTYQDEGRIDGARIFKDEGVYPQYYGSYHIHHRIDGKLVAINVWDITECTLSSIYTFYDPEYSFLSLGHVTAVREMEYMRKIQKEYNSSMRYYYMGYYVHNCQKSMYKEHMHPQNLLCPITYTYVPLTAELKAKIVKDQFLQLNPDADPVTNSNFEQIAEYIVHWKLVHNRDTFLAMGQVRRDMAEKFSTQLVSIHKIMGDILFEKFLFEYL